MCDGVRYQEVPKHLYKDELVGVSKSLKVTVHHIYSNPFCLLHPSALLQVDEEVVSYLFFGQLEPGLDDDGEAGAVVVAGRLDADEHVLGAGEGRLGGGGAAGRRRRLSAALYVVLGQAARRALLPADLHLSTPYNNQTVYRYRQAHSTLGAWCLVSLLPPILDEIILHHLLSAVRLQAGPRRKSQPL